MKRRGRISEVGHGFRHVAARGVAPLHDGKRLAPLALPPIEAHAVPSPVSPSTALTIPSEAGGGDALSPAVAPLVAAHGGRGRDEANHAVAQWPSRPRETPSKPGPLHTSRAPLALQLEAFIRKEHRLYLVEHPNCARAETLHIFREALSVFVTHFPEYRAVLHLIRDEYEAVLQDVTEQVRQMKVLDMENKSDRSLHAMELMQLKESLNTTISNQQAQLHATQGLLHALREQLAAAEHANALLKFELESKLSEYKHGQEQVQLLSRAMIEESARSARIVEEAKKKDREMELLRAREVVLRESLSELEACLQQQMQQQQLLPPHVDLSHSPGPPSNSPDRTFVNTPQRSPSLQNTPSTYAYSDEFVVNALQQLDMLRFELAALRDKEQQQQQQHAAPGTASTPRWWMHTDAPPPRLRDFAEASCGGNEVVQRSEDTHDERPDKPHQTAVDGGSPYPVIEQWLRDEGIGEAELESTDTLLPPGLWPGEELAFLKVCTPVHNRHFTLDNLLQLIDELWTARERQVSTVAFRPFFLEWLSAQTGSPSGAKELGFNLLYGCQRNTQHPDCRACLCILRGFLPEKMVLSCRAALQRLRTLCAEATATERGVIAMDTLCAHVREVFPAMSQAHMLQLRFYLHRLTDGGRKSLGSDVVFAPRSSLVTLLKAQFMREVEADTLYIVEGLRQVADAGRDAVRIRRVLEVFRAFDPGMSRDTWHRLVAESCQKSVMDIAVADEVSIVRLDPLLTRLRSTVLVHRLTPMPLIE